MGMLSEEAGARTTLYCATDPALATESGFYYDDCQKKDPNPLANDQAIVDELYNKSKEFVSEYLS